MGRPGAASSCSCGPLASNALAALDDAFEGSPPLDRLPLFRDIAPREVKAVRQMIAKGLRAPLAHGAGRYFDALGALGLPRPRASYEGQVALEWDLIAAEPDSRGYGFDVSRERGLLEVDLRPTIRGAVRDLLAGDGAARVSARFHETLAEAGAGLVREAAAEHGPLPVVLSGGCFQNARLAEGVRRRLAPHHDVHLHREVPPGDGGIALGQALVADAVAGR
jgi:hydrogenase maturation protein HypF